MASEDRVLVQDCIDEHMDDFTTYDRAVEVVSSWQSIFSRVYKDELTHFDRFPVMGDNKLTPDFSVLLMEEYGIVAEVKRTFPNDEKPFRKEMDQLMRYDAPLPFKVDSEGTTKVPEKHDILLIVSLEDSFEISKRIQGLLDDNESDVSFDRNLVLVDNAYESADRICRYVFRKLPFENRPFRDEILPEEKRLETIMGLQRKAFSVPPVHFIDYKIRHVLCNDSPPPLYTAVYLWNTIFPNYLSEDDMRIWQRKNPKKNLPIEVNIEKLKSSINEHYIPEGNVRSHWLRKALEFLKAAGFADQTAPNDYEVKFSNLAYSVGPRKLREEGGGEKEIIREYAFLFSRWFCERVLGKKTMPEKTQAKKKTSVVLLEEFSKESPDIKDDSSKQ